MRVTRKGTVKEDDQCRSEKSTVPSAALHLQLAKEQVEQARALIKRNENERAKYVLARAAADAELAVALAREKTMSDEAQKALEQVQSLQGSRAN